VLKIRHFLKWQAVGGQAKATKHQPS